MCTDTCSYNKGKCEEPKVLKISVHSPYSPANTAYLFVYINHTTLSAQQLSFFSLLRLMFPPMYRILLQAGTAESRIPNVV